MKISAQFMPGDLPVFVDSVRKAEEAGYARAYLVEGQLLWRDVYVYMAHGLAPALGPCAWPAQWRTS
jgi:hypothetical protein